MIYKFKFRQGFLVTIILFIVISLFISPQKTDAYCAARNVVCADWSDYNLSHCPNNYGLQCWIRKCEVTADLVCNLGVLCGPSTGYSCLPNCFDEMVVLCNNSCGENANVTTEYLWYQIDPETSCDYYLCFCECRDNSAWKETAHDDCYDD